MTKASSSKASSAFGTANPLSVWPQEPDATSPKVPERYFGVWSRSLLETPEKRDTTTFVRWMQLGRWHVDLRVPAAGSDPCQGFSGITRISQVGGRDVCTWQRMVDYTPPRDSVDEGWVDFESSERLIETGIHGVYHEVWDRLHGSVGQRIALAEQRQDSLPQARLFVSGNCLMRVRPCAPVGPAFEISFGRWERGVWRIEQSTIAALRGQSVKLAIVQTGPQTARVTQDASTREWTVLEFARLEY
jgi:hypothetical protein